MYLGTLYIYTKFRPDRISNMAVRPGNHLEKSTKTCYSWTNGWIISKFVSSNNNNKDTWRNNPFFLFDLLFKATEVSSSKQIR
jgi:hypothetical protein